MFRENTPIYQQIKEIMIQRIISGVWAEDELIPSVRSMAKELGVNPNTVMRTVTELQAQEILVIDRGIGNNLARGAKEKLRIEGVKSFTAKEVPIIVSKAKMLGMKKEKLIELIEGEW